MAAVFRGSEAEEDRTESNGNGRKLFQRLTGEEKAKTKSFRTGGASRI
jgi:hypothetical protein